VVSAPGPGAIAATWRGARPFLGAGGGEMSSSEEVETLPMSMVSPSGLVALVRRGGMIVMEGII
jgi:hypothetical protein